MAERKGKVLMGLLGATPQAGVVRGEGITLQPMPAGLRSARGGVIGDLIAASRPRSLYGPFPSEDVIGTELGT